MKPNKKKPQDIVKQLMAEPMGLAFVITALDNLSNDVKKNAEELRKQKHAFIAPEVWISLAEQWDGRDSKI